MEMQNERNVDDDLQLDPPPPPPHHVPFYNPHLINWNWDDVIVISKHFLPCYWISFEINFATFYDLVAHCPMYSD